MKTEDARFNQTKLTDLTPFRKVSVLDVGGGAVGSYLAELQAKMGLNHLSINDIDRYELDNASKTSSLIKLSEADGAEDDGKWKAEALAERVETVMIKGSKANGIVGSVENLGPMAFSAFDYVCAAPDNKAVREYINQQLKELPPEKRPVYIVGGTDGEMATSAVFDDLDKACYRCMCEEHSFRSSRRRTSCADAQYRFTKEGKEETIIVSNLSSVKAALMMADDLRAKATGKLPNGNRSRVWNPDSLFPPITCEEPARRDDCPDCAKIRPPKEVYTLDGDVMTSTLRSVLKQIHDVLKSDDFALSVHRHHFGEDSFTEYVQTDYCRSCGKTFGVYRHTRFVNTEKDLLCEACRSRGAEVRADVTPGEVNIRYGFTPDESDARILDATLFELGYPIGAFLLVTQYNGANDLSDERVRNYCFSMNGDLLIVKKNINLMEAFKSGQR